MSKLFGRGLLYIFVGTYYLNVVSGGVESEPLFIPTNDDLKSIFYCKMIAIPTTT